MTERAVDCPLLVVYDLNETNEMRLARLANVFGDVAYDEGCTELFGGMHVIMGMKQAMQTYFCLKTLVRKKAC